MYNTFRFTAQVTGFKTGLTLLAPGSGSAFVEACLSKFMGFKCTVIDLPNVIANFKAYYDWAGFETISTDIDMYANSDGRKYDVVMSLENIEHIHAAPSKYIAKFVNDIASGGHFIISTPNCGSIAHIIKLLMMVPILRDPDITFDLNSHTHYREYMPCEIIEAYEKNGLTLKKLTYTNPSPFIRKYDTSSNSMHYVKNSVLKFIFRWSLYGIRALFGIIPRFRYMMIVAAQKPID